MIVRSMMIRTSEEFTPFDRAFQMVVRSMMIRTKIPAKTREGKQSKQMKIDSITDNALDNYFDNNVNNAKISNENDIERKNQNAGSIIDKFSKYDPNVTKTYKTKLKEWGA